MNKIVVFCGASIGFNNIYKEAAKELANYFVNNNMSLVYGGGKIGMMGVISNTMLKKNGEVIGVIPYFLEKEEVVNVDVEEMIVCKTMSERKVIMSKMADGYITLPGGFGTLDELFEVLTLQQLHLEQKPVGLLNVNGFFDPMLDQLKKMVEEGYLKADNKNYLLVADNVKDLMSLMINHKQSERKSVIDKIVN